MKRYENYYDLKAIYIDDYKGAKCYNVLSAPKSRQYKFYLKQSRFRKILFKCNYLKTKKD